MLSEATLQNPEGRATGWQPRNKPICMTLGSPIDFSVLQEYRQRTITLLSCDWYLKNLMLVLEFLIFFQKFQLSSAADISFLIHFTPRYLLSEIVLWYVSGWWIQ